MISIHFFVVSTGDVAFVRNSGVSARRDLTIYVVSSKENNMTIDVTNVFNIASTIVKLFKMRLVTNPIQTGPFFSNRPPRG